MTECIFCKIAKGEFNTAFLYEDDQIAAFHDITPQAPVHVLIIPKIHAASIKDISDPLLIGHMFNTAKKIAQDLNLNSYRLVINTGEDAGQTVFHLHLHLLGGRRFNWPPG
jgi:histidine triad (HIT) family protein